uniref:Uncharacterized protein n=1 Tax=Rhizophora mucronata TaxID=61149 RepID=A0A2P2PW88_RHIMU
MYIVYLVVISKVLNFQ